MGRGALEASLRLVDYLDGIISVCSEKKLYKREAVHALSIGANVYVLVDYLNSCYTLDLSTVALRCRMSYTQLLRSVAKHAEWIHETRCSTAHAKPPTHLTSILAGPQFLSEPLTRRSLQYFVTHKEWHALWTLIGDDLLRHILLNTILLLSVQSDGIGQPSVFVQLTGRLFTYAVERQLRRPVVVSCERDAAVVAVHCARPELTASSASPLETAKNRPSNPLIQRRFKQNRRRRKQQHALATTEPHSIVCTKRCAKRCLTRGVQALFSAQHLLQRCVNKKRLFHSTTFRRQYTFSPHSSLSCFVTTTAIATRIVKPIEPLPDDLKSHIFTALRPFLMKLKTSFDTLDCLSLFRVCCHPAKTRRAASKFLIAHELCSRDSKNLPNQKCSYRSSFPSSHAATPILQLATPHKSIGRFAFRCLRRLIEPRLVGGKQNYKRLLKAVFRVLFGPRFERLPIRTLLHGCRLSSFNRLIRLNNLGENNLHASKTHPQCPSGQTSCASSPGLLQALLSCLFLYCIEDLIVPILSNFFFVTTSEITAQRPIYFIKPVWCLLRKAQARIFYREAHLIPASADIRTLKTRCSFPKLLWIPKLYGCRPRVNLSKPYSGELLEAYARTVVGGNALKHQLYWTRKRRRRVGYRSVNEYLGGAQLLLTLWMLQGHKTEWGASVLGFPLAFRRWISWNRTASRDKKDPNGPFIVVADLRGCYESINHTAVIRSFQSLSMPDVLRATKLCIRQLDQRRTRTVHYLLPTEGSSLRHTDGYKICFPAHSDASRPLFVCDLNDDFQLTRAALLDILTHHLRSLYVQVDEPFEAVRSHLPRRQGSVILRQTSGLPQGSAVSSILCAAYYACMDVASSAWKPAPDELLLRWVDDFLFISPSASRCAEFLHQLLYAHQWGDNINWSKVKVNHPSILEPFYSGAVSTHNTFSASDKLQLNATVDSRLTWAMLSFSANQSHHQLGVDIIPSTKTQLIFSCLRDAAPIITTEKLPTRLLQAALDKRLMSYLTIKLGNRIPFSNQTNNPTSIRTNYQILGVNVARRLVVALANLKKTMGIRVNTPKLLALIRRVCGLVFRLSKPLLTLTEKQRFNEKPEQQVTLVQVVFLFRTALLNTLRRYNVLHGYRNVRSEFQFTQYCWPTLYRPPMTSATEAEFCNVFTS